MIRPRFANVRFGLFGDWRKPMLEEVQLLSEWQLHCPTDHRQESKHDKWEQHDLWAFVRREVAVGAVIRRVIVPFGFAVEHHDHLACHVVRGE